MRFTKELSIVFGALVLMTGVRAGAEIVVDDFDTAFQIVLPDMLGQNVLQSNIGALAAQRYAGATACCGPARPAGQIDTNLTMQSAMTVAINRANPDPTYGSVGIG